MRRLFPAHPIVSLLLALFTAATFAPAARAQVPDSLGEVRALLNSDGVAPGQQATVAVVLDVTSGYHAQSAEPLTDSLVPTRIEVTEARHARTFAPVYAEGHVENYPAISPETGGDMSVYTGRSVHYVPIEVAADADPGEKLRLNGTLRFQACDDAACFQPQTLTWAVEVPIVAVGTRTTAANAELFTDFDPSIWSRIELPPAPGSAGQTGSFLGLSFDLASSGPAMVLSLAFVAGIFFNLVPCVLPVLPLKAIGFYESAGQSRAKSLVHGASFSLGIVLTFAALAVLIFAFGWISWGEMFASPWFAGGVTLVLLAAAAYQFGLFSVMLPSKLYSLDSGRRDGVAGNVAFGAFTAVLSTPCTFGLFAALLVWAASQPTWLGVAAVTTVGAGMASPYLLLSAFPEIARAFPRTGRWSEVIKKATGFLLLAVAAYFARPILPDVLRGPGVWWVVYACVAAGGVFLLYEAIRIGGTRPIVVTAVLALLLGGGTLPLAYRLANPPAGWVKYSDAALAEARQEGGPVLVKFTADWCANCQAVEQRVFGTQEQVDRWIDGAGLTLVKADLTDADASGWPLLEQLNPARAIPFTAVYLPGENRPHPLAGIYGSDDLQRVLDD